MNTLDSQIDAAVSAGKLLPSSAENIRALLSKSTSPVAAASLDELVAASAWEELNDRFFRTIAFGTGGLRGRTIGKVVTKAETGTLDALGRPEFACIGTNAMNDYNISRAAQGLVAYLLSWFKKEKIAGRPKIVIAHDTRHFSRHFAELTARIATQLGCDAALLEGPRSTPELSFAVRHLGATAGIVLTASHNPPHDNGFKCYFADGAQVVDPHASGIIERVNAVAGDVFTPVPEAQRGVLEIVGTSLDEAYMERLATLVLDPAVVRAASALKVVFTAIHGTGGVITVPMLKRLGFSTLTVPEQDVMDGRFPTVKSPNPENAEALSMGLAIAEKEGADLVVATDPDCDRMGVAVRTGAGSLQLLTGNQIGSLMAWYRAMKLIEQGVLTDANKARGVIIKTVVTTDLQKAIADKLGLRCVETLTGFKYIGAKLGAYENALPAEIREKYRTLPEAETRAARLAHSSFYVCGGEESYGYSGADFVRDKDGNGAVVMFAEVAAYAKGRGITLDVLLDELYAEFGFYLEKNGALTFEGAEGAAKIAQLAAGYAANPPDELAGVKLKGVINFFTDTIFDSEGDRLPAEKMMMFDLADGTRVAVRPSGTEPKIKYYHFAKRIPAAGKRFTGEELADIKTKTAAWLEKLWEALQADAHARLA